MSALVFMDTETTGLSLTDDIWEFAGIRREEDGTETELHLFIEHDDAKCRRLPESFRADHAARFPAHCSGNVTAPTAAAYEIRMFTGNRAHIVGAVPNFDTERIALMFERYSVSRPDWHHHLIDVEALAVGYLCGRGHLDLEDSGAGIALPWESDHLSRLCHVEPPTTERHTAMGDARWAMALYDAITGSGR